ncbi:hypothetical protein ACQP3J_29890, partial [Escherichia coli]
MSKLNELYVLNICGLLDSLVIGLVIRRQHGLGPKVYICIPKYTDKCHNEESVGWVKLSEPKTVFSSGKFFKESKKGDLLPGPQ